MKKPLFFLFSFLLLLSCNKEDKLLNQFAGAWELEKITVTHFSNGKDTSSQEYKDCGTWSLFDNGMTGNTFNLSYLILNEAIPVVLASNLQVQPNGRHEGFVDWGSVDSDDKRILFEIQQGNQNKDVAMNVEKINRNKFVFFYFTMDPQNNDHVKEVQRFELKRSNQ